MKIIKSNFFSGTFLIGAVSIFLLFALQSCSSTRKAGFLTSAVVPAAKGKVIVKEDKQNGNYSIRINIEDLADPSRLQSPKNVYVVWMETEQHGINN
ncbi:MAG: hypothetical protein WAU24_02620, partial [Chitinophagaceae bacterium]